MSNRLLPNSSKLSPSWPITPLSPPTTHVTISDLIVGNPTSSLGGISGGSGIPTSTSVPTTSGSSTVNAIHGVPTESTTTITTTLSTQPPPSPTMAFISQASTSMPQLITNTLTATKDVTRPPDSTLLVSASQVTSGSVTVKGGGDVGANTSSNDSTTSITLKTSSGSAIKDFEGVVNLEIVNPMLQPIDSISSTLGKDVALPAGNSVSRNSSSDAEGVVDHSVVGNILPDANVGEKKPLISTGEEATKVIGDHLVTNEHPFAPWYKYGCADVLLSLDPEGRSSNGTKATLHRWENFWDNGSVSSRLQNRSN